MSDALYLILLIGVVLVSLFLVLLVLMQRPKQEGLGATFGVDATNQMFGSRTTDVLQKGTTYLAVVFFLLALGIGMLNAHESKRAEKLGQRLTELPKVEPTPPPAETPAPEAEGTPAETPAPAIETPAPAEAPAAPAAEEESSTPAETPASAAEETPATEPAETPAPETPETPESAPAPEPAPAPQQ